MDTESHHVVYLIGAGASHGCVDAVGSQHGILMRDLYPELAEGAGDLLRKEKYESHGELTDLVNEVASENMDPEHIITFLDQSPSAIHRDFAEDLKKVFEDVLREKLDAINKELGDPPTKLYEALIDMHEHPDFDEELGGIITINYDQYIERAIETFPERRVDFGVKVRGGPSEGKPIRLLKLHGSLGWNETWPIAADTSESTLWIPPGIQKTKDRYPFNVLWGRAREMLNCDVLRIIGCGLSANDWDLVSLLFNTRLTNARNESFAIEVIDSPSNAQHVSEKFPYLNIRSLLEIDRIGPNLISEFLGGSPRSFGSLSEFEEKEVLKKAAEGHNWFQIWLTQMAELMIQDFETVGQYGRLEALLEAS